MRATAALTYSLAGCEHKHVFVFKLVVSCESVSPSLTVPVPRHQSAIRPDAVPENHHVHRANHAFILLRLRFCGRGLGRNRRSLGVLVVCVATSTEYTPRRLKVGGVRALGFKLA